MLTELRQVSSTNYQSITELSRSEPHPPMELKANNDVANLTRNPSEKKLRDIIATHTQLLAQASAIEMKVDTANKKYSHMPCPRNICPSWGSTISGISTCLSGVVAGYAYYNELIIIESVATVAAVLSIFTYCRMRCVEPRAAAAEELTDSEEGVVRLAHGVTALASEAKEAVALSIWVTQEDAQQQSLLMEKTLKDHSENNDALNKRIKDLQDYQAKYVELVEILANIPDNNEALKTQMEMLSAQFKSKPLFDLSEFKRVQQKIIDQRAAGNDQFAQGNAKFSLLIDRENSLKKTLTDTLGDLGVRIQALQAENEKARNLNEQLGVLQSQISEKDSLLAARVDNERKLQNELQETESKLKVLVENEENIQTLQTIIEANALEITHNKEQLESLIAEKAILQKTIEENNAKYHFETSQLQQQISLLAAAVSTMEQQLQAPVRENRALAAASATSEAPQLCMEPPILKRSESWPPRLPQRPLPKLLVRP